MSASPRERSRSARLAFRGYLASIVALGAVAVWSALHGDIASAFGAVAFLAADFAGLAIVFVVLVVTLLLGVFLPAAFGTLMLITRLVERRSASGPSGAGVDPKQLAELDPQGARAIGLIGFLSSGYAYIAVAGGLALDLIRWVGSLPARAASAPRRIRRRLGERDRGRLRRGWTSAVAPWASWAVGERALWLYTRPLLALAGVVSIFAFGHAPFWVELLAAIAAILGFRFVRFPLAGIATAIIALSISPAAALLIAARILLGEALIWHLGGSGPGVGARRARGLEAIAARRCDAASRLFGASPQGLEESRRAFGTAVRTEDEDTALEAATAYAISAWARWRWRECLALARRVIGGVVRGEWTDAKERTGIERTMLSMVLFEEVSTIAARLVPLSLAGAAAFLFLPPGDGLLSNGGLWGQFAMALATVLIASPLTRRQLGFASALFNTLIALLLVGPGVWQPIGIAIATAFTVPTFRRLGENFNLTGRARWRRWPVPAGTPRGLRRHWRIASEAIEGGNDGVALDILKQLADQPKVSDELFVAALGRAALLEVDLGRLQAASEHLDEISGRGGEMTGSAAVARGMLAVALGDYQGAKPILRDALEGLEDSSPLAPRATMALADALARSGEPDAAIELLEGLRSEPLAMRGFAAILEGQIAIVLALLERRERARATEVLEDLDSLIAEDMELPFDRESKRRWHRAGAQGLTLRGRLKLDSRASAAVPFLARAIELARLAGDEALGAAAESLYGVALVGSGSAEDGVAKIASGVERLEARRVQLRTADRRTAMIAADEAHYSWALRGLLGGQRAGVQGAAITAARLIESLRQSALAATLRSGPLPLGEETLGLITQIQAGERDGGEVESLRVRVGEEISERFAAAYLPTSVSGDQLRQVAARFGHVLSFYVPPSGLPGWRVWISPAGEVQLDEIRASGGGLLAGIAKAGEITDTEVHTPLLANTVAWERLGEELLPAALRDGLRRTDPESPERILIVPDGLLALIPWAALHVGGRPLIESAILQVTPALDLLDQDHAPSRPSEWVLAHLFEAKNDRELAPLQPNGGVQVVETRDSFLEALDSELFDGAYLASHGRNIGLHQEVEFSEGSRLSAASALACKWPPWVIFSSCLVGRVEQVTGQEPFGLAVSCMLRGADTVVASVVELTDPGATACGVLAAGLAEGSAPAETLRAAQLSQLRSSSLHTLSDGLGLVCISTAGPIAERSSIR